MTLAQPDVCLGCAAMQGDTDDDLQVHAAAATEPTCGSQVGASKRCHQECRGCTCSAAPKADLTVTAQACSTTASSGWLWVCSHLQRGSKPLWRQALSALLICSTAQLALSLCCPAPLPMA